ncbi:hypothetical protein FACS1894199_11020 [Bacteroidia bacterium]|nr:hypothetical protein FACS1894199_11020 [Bacteroidia bacterium]
MPIEENLFLNTLSFEFPKEPVTFYFSLEDRTDCRLTMLKKHNLFPQNIKDIFPNIVKSDMLFTSFDRQTDGLLPLAVDFRLPENYFLVKRFYNRLISGYLKNRGLFVEPNHITKDNQAWKLNNYENSRQDCNLYDRFTLKVDYDHFNRRPQLILSFDRPALVYKTSVETLLTSADTDPFTPSDTPQPTADLVNRVLYEQPVTREDGTVYNIRKIDKHKYLSENWKEYNTQFAYPIMNRKLAAYLGFDDETDEEQANANSQYADFMPKNRYKKYYDKIKYFYQTFLDNADFRVLFPIAKDGFFVGKQNTGQTYQIRQ